MLVCFLALVLVRVAEQRSNETWRTIRTELGQIRLGHFQGPDGTFAQTTELTARQRELLAALSVTEPPRFARISAPSAPAAA